MKTIRMRHRALILLGVCGIGAIFVIRSTADSPPTNQVPFELGMKTIRMRHRALILLGVCGIGAIFVIRSTADSPPTNQVPFELGMKTIRMRHRALILLGVCGIGAIFVIRSTADSPPTNQVPFELGMKTIRMRHRALILLGVCGIGAIFVIRSTADSPPTNQVPFELGMKTIRMRHRALILLGVCGIGAIFVIRSTADSPPTNQVPFELGMKTIRMRHRALILLGVCGIGAIFVFRSTADSPPTNQVPFELGMKTIRMRHRALILLGVCGIGAIFVIRSTADSPPTNQVPFELGMKTIRMRHRALILLGVCGIGAIFVIRSTADSPPTNQVPFELGMKTIRMRHRALILLGVCGIGAIFVIRSTADSPPTNQVPFELGMKTIRMRHRALILLGVCGIGAIFVIRSTADSPPTNQVPFELGMKTIRMRHRALILLGVCGIGAIFVIRSTADSPPTNQVPFELGMKTIRMRHRALILLGVCGIGAIFVIRSTADSPPTNQVPFELGMKTIRMRHRALILLGVCGIGAIFVIRSTADSPPTNQVPFELGMKTIRMRHRALILLGVCGIGAIFVIRSTADSPPTNQSKTKTRVDKMEQRPIEESRITAEKRAQWFAHPNVGRERVPVRRLVEDDTPRPVPTRLPLPTRPPAPPAAPRDRQDVPPPAVAHRDRQEAPPPVPVIVHWKEQLEPMRPPSGPRHLSPLAVEENTPRRYVPEDPHVLPLKNKAYPDFGDNAGGRKDVGVGKFSGELGKGGRPEPRKGYPNILKGKFIPANKIVHFDLKGAAPKVDYFREVFKLIASMGATGVLMEWEDMFPFNGEFADVAQSQAYTAAELRQILGWARDAKLDIIPLVQTFGHLEYILKYPKWAKYRQVDRYPQVICLGDEEAVGMVKRIVDQVMAIHKDFPMPYFHIGADEAFQIGMCVKDQEIMAKELGNSRERLMLRHIADIAAYVQRKYNTKVLMWHDMLNNVDNDMIKEYKLGDLVEPVVWAYAENLNEYLFPDMWQRFGDLFPNMWGGSAFKGADGPSRYYSNVPHYLQNHISWVGQMTREYKNFQEFRGLILTGWQRFDHFAVLCEILPVGLPSLAVNLYTVSRGVYDRSVLKEASTALGCSSTLDIDSQGVGAYCTFPGAKVYQLVQQLRISLANIQTNFYDDYQVHGWLSRFNIRHNYSQPWYLDQINDKLQMYLGDLRGLQMSLRAELGTMFFPDMVSEWLFEYVSPDLERLEEMESAIKRLSAAKAFPARPFPILSTRTTTPPPPPRRPLHRRREPKDVPPNDIL